MKYWFYRSICLKIIYVFVLHVLNKNENIISARYWHAYFVKIAEINSQQKNQSSQKISSRKTQKIAANPQKYTPTKISCYTVSLLQLNHGLLQT